MIYLVVPCFNEVKRLDFKAFTDFQSASLFTRPVQIVFVDDGSVDGTHDWIQKKMDQLKSETESLTQEQIFNFKLERNSGKAEAVRQGMLYVQNRFKVGSTDWVGFWDADLATPLLELNKMVQMAAEEPGTESVWGSRVYRLGSEIKRSPLRHYLGRAFATVISILLKVESYDTQCGAKIFRGDKVGEAFNEPFISRWIFDVEILLRLRQKNIIEYPLRKWVDQPGSKVKVIREIGRVWGDILAIRKKYHQRN